MQMLGLVVGRHPSCHLRGVMVFTFARVSAACCLNVGDIFHQQRRLWVRLHEKGRQAPRDAMPPHARGLPRRIHRAFPAGRIVEDLGRHAQQRHLARHAFAR